MQAERWKEIEHLCGEALEREEGQRAEFLQSACAGDEVLLREVQSLLAHQKQAEHFIETPALEQTAKALADGERDSQRLGATPPPDRSHDLALPHRGAPRFWRHGRSLPGRPRRTTNIRNWLL
jgi:hypothetical protein